MHLSATLVNASISAVRLAGDVVGGADRAGGFPVGAQVGDVLFQGGQVGGVGPVEAAAGALEADRAGTAAGGDVGRFGAVAERDGDRGPLVGGGTGERGGVSVGVGGQRSDGADGLLFAFEADPVVAHGGGHRDVIHELFEHVDRYSGVGVALGVGVAQCVWRDQGGVERGWAAVGAEQVAVDGADLGHPGLEGPADAAGVTCPCDCWARSSGLGNSHWRWRAGWAAGRGGPARSITLGGLGR